MSEVLVRAFGHGHMRLKFNSTSIMMINEDGDPRLTEFSWRVCNDICKKTSFMEKVSFPQSLPKLVRKAMSCASLTRVGGISSCT